MKTNYQAIEDFNKNQDKYLDNFKIEMELKKQEDLEKIFSEKKRRLEEYQEIITRTAKEMETVINDKEQSDDARTTIANILSEEIEMGNAIVKYTKNEIEILEKILKHSEVKTDKKTEEKKEEKINTELPKEKNSIDELKKKKEELEKLVKEIESKYQETKWTFKNQTYTIDERLQDEVKKAELNEEIEKIDKKIKSMADNDEKKTEHPELKDSKTVIDEDETLKKYYNDGFGKNIFGHFFNPYTDDYDENYTPLKDPNFIVNKAIEEKIVHEKKNEEKIVDEEATLKKYYNDGFDKNIFGYFFNPYTDDYDENYTPLKDENYIVYKTIEKEESFRDSESFKKLMDILNGSKTDDTPKLPAGKDEKKEILGLPAGNTTLFRNVNGHDDIDNMTTAELTEAIKNKKYDKYADSEDAKDLMELRLSELKNIFRNMTHSQISEALKNKEYEKYSNPENVKEIMERELEDRKKREEKILVQERKSKNKKVKFSKIISPLVSVKNHIKERWEHVKSTLSITKHVMFDKPVDNDIIIEEETETSVR